MEKLGLLANDPWLEPYASVIEARYEWAQQLERKYTDDGHQSLSEYASGYLYFGLFRTKEGWVVREWAPNATAIYLVGDCNGWSEQESFAMKPLDHGVWELQLSSDQLSHESLYKLSVHWSGGKGERIPAWTRRVVQDPQTHLFAAQVWAPAKPYTFKIKKFKPSCSPLMIYECHIGMAQSEEKVGSYREFREKVLPRIAAAGYNCIQIMAIQEHPYYGSFGYHVSSFFAASSRFGTPDELKELIDEAHRLKIAVIMDLVHSHAVKNELEGLGRYDGSTSQFFHQGDRRLHNQWDSLCFDYGKEEVVHFLLSNCKFWLEEYRFDGFRFDGVTSMLYYNHGLGQSFNGYGDYYDGSQDGDAIAYLTMANKVIHEVNPHAITVAEEMSGMPGLALPTAEGGLGFDYRMAMGIPDYWIKTIKEKRDEKWSPMSIWWELTNRRSDEKTISYAESHDQALVGDKTIIFRLIDAAMYWHMSKSDNHFMVNRGISLHKIIRLVTASTINGGYLNFMGNEFGHPEWIDFPREGNGWSHKYARRQWELVDRKDLKYHYMGDFDRAMITLLSSVRGFEKSELQKVWDNEEDQILCFRRKNLLFVFNFSPTKSYSDYGFLVPRGKYRIRLNSDHPDFGGFGRVNEQVDYLTHFDPVYKKARKEWIKLYVPTQTALVLELVKE